MKKKVFGKILLLVFISILFNSCNGFFKYSPARENPTKGMERAKKNVEEGRGVTLGGLARGRGGTNYEFSTSNPMWRASLEILDFLPMTTVDYSGGIIISDWYTDGSSSNQDSIKITIRFLSNEIRSDSLKIIIHKKKCGSNQSCTVDILPNSKISQELRASIIRKASLIEKDSKNKKKK
tara:strand:- start:433 stop:972 length:540 start_codon:yes stop_codon:yes gene_type:complete